jgi:hypothetical protein
MSRKNESADRFNLSGKYTHTDYYDKHGNKVGSKVDRYDLGGKYTHSDNYDKHGNKTGTSDNEYKDSDSRGSSSGGCFITTAVCDFLQKPDDCYELTLLRKFRDNWLAKEEYGTELITEYYFIAPTIVKSIDKYSNRNSIYEEIYIKYILSCIRLIENDKNKECMLLYIEMVENLKNRFFAIKNA